MMKEYHKPNTGSPIRSRSGPHNRIVSPLGKKSTPPHEVAPLFHSLWQRSGSIWSGCLTVIHRVLLSKSFSSSPEDISGSPSCPLRFPRTFDRFWNHLVFSGLKSQLTLGSAGQNDKGRCPLSSKDRLRISTVVRPCISAAIKASWSSIFSARANQV